ncbi:MAG TPA: HD-GYP domain-containing protein [Solirubrobacteraceae bacterium]|nr:HD-GYP domain-containing protein [Solirubrobacteraceae bacterium]
MDLDSYLSPGAERLLRSAQQRREQTGSRRGLRAELSAAGLFLIWAAVLATTAHWDRPLSAASLIVSAVVFIVARRVTFPVGSATTSPTQIAYVPMLFVLPTPVVPAVVGACALLSMWPELMSGRLALRQFAACLADCLYALVPATILVLAGAQHFAWHRWPVIVLALAAQFIFDATAGLTRTWWADRVRPTRQPQMLWLYFTDACFSCVGLTVAAIAAPRPGLILMTLPTFVLLSIFAEERRGRLDRTLELSSAYAGAATLLGDLIDAVDHYTGVHTRDVVALSSQMAAELALDETRRRDVQYTALLHDVGKIRVPASIINKPGALDEEEWRVMRRHTIEGEKMLRQVGGTLAGVGRFVRASHERYDGGGYPDGLAGEAIPLEARIVCVCDAYNAMTTDRPYRRARRHDEAMQELRRCSGSQFDPQLVEVIERVLTRRRGSVATPAGESATERPVRLS